MQWEFCPRAYKYMRIDKLPFVPTLPMKIGSAFHDYADSFMTLLSYEELREADDPGIIHDIYEECAVGIETPKAIEKYAQNFREFEYKRFLGFISEYEDPVTWYEPLHIENKFVVLNAFRETDLHIDLSGIIDRIDPTRVEDREVKSIALIEYKTGNLSKVSLDKELPFYHLLVDRCTKYTSTKFPPVSHLVAYSPVLDDTYIQLADLRKVARVANRLMKMTEDVQRGYFPHKENMFCHSCAGLEACMESDITREMILEMCESAAYTSTELGAILDTRPSTVKAILSDMQLEGLVNRSYKGNTEYWWKPDDNK